MNNDKQKAEKPDGFICIHKDGDIRCFEEDEINCVKLLIDQYPLSYEKGHWRIRPVKLVFLDED